MGADALEPLWYASFMYNPRGIPAVFVCSLLIACSEEAVTVADAVDGASDADIDIGDAPPSDGLGPARLQAYCGPDWQAVEARIDDLLGVMTLDQKISQMSGVHPLPQNNTWATPELTELGVPGLKMIDGPRGVSTWAGQATAFPVGVARAATFDPELERRVGVAMAREVRGLGSNTILAPTINVLRHPRWGRSQETYGEDPWLLGTMGAAYVKGVQSEGVLATAKHYAVNSIEDTRFEVDVNLDERTLREIYLPHFRKVVVDANVATVMSAYNLVHGTYCGEHPHLLRDILKGEWGFVGLVMSDWLLGTHNTVASALAGLDIEMPAAQFYGDALKAEVEQGSVPISVIDDAVRRILRAQLCYALDSAPAVIDPTAVESTEARALAREVATRGSVLLKNDGLLPLDPTGLTRVVIVGELAATENIGDTGSSNVKSSEVVTLLEGFEAALPGAVTHVASYPFTTADEDAILDADAVLIVVGLTHEHEGEGVIGAGDRESLTLPDDQPEMVAAAVALNTSSAVLMMGGGAITMDPWLDSVAAVMMVWYPGVEGGHAVADLVLGNANPSGRVPMTFPASQSELPEFDNVSLSVSYDYWHGYRWHQRQSVLAAFPFGFGLSYTTFSYDAVRVVASDATSITVEVDVSNTGSVAGIEVVQLYMSPPPGGGVERPARELVAAAPLQIAAGATGTMTLSVARADLAIWDDGWTTPSGTYILAAGPNADDQPRSTTVDIGP